MEVFVSTVLGICVCASLSLALINCVRCRKRLTEEELQQKYFEKFRKKHMSTRDRVLTNRVDVIRPRSDSQVSSMSCDKDPTYQTIRSVDSTGSQKSDKSTVDDHSFFDESFQTVVEASSYNTTGQTDSNGNSNLLSASTNLASYISFQQQHQLSPSSIPILQIPDVRSTPRSGKINPAFSGDSSSDSERRAYSNSDSDDYVRPNRGPRIIVTKPSIKIVSSQHKDKIDNSNLTNDSSEDLLSPDCQEDGKYSRLDSDLALDMPCSDDIQSPVQMKSHIDKLYRDKLRMEGKSYNNKHINKCDHKSKGKTKLVIPRSRIHISETDSDEEHTYESLSSITAEANLRNDSVDIVEETSFPSRRRSTDNEHTYESIMSKSCESLITSIAKPVNKDLPKINVEKVNETDNSQSNKSTRSSDSDTAVVIIGRKVSWRYKPILPTPAQKADNQTASFSRDLQTMLSQSYKSPPKSRRNSLDRYSPFPSSTKKLAFKSPFNKVSSPRFGSMQVKSGHLKPTLLTELLNSASKSIGIENFNVDTPEMKVKDSPKVFTVDSTVFLSPLDCVNKQENSPPVNTDFSPLTFVPTPINDLRTKFNAPIRESLPSLPDDLELVIENHCNTTVNAMSTPTV